MSRLALRLTPLAVAALAATLACSGSDKKKSCDVANQSGCDAGLVCEAVEGGDPGCFQPLVVRGAVFDLGTSLGIENARVVALDANRSPISTVALTDSVGEFHIQVANPRAKDGTPLARDLFLRADAQGYATFPSGIREALPIHTADAVKTDKFLEVATEQTDVGLIALPSAGTGIVSGTAAVPKGQPGVLVVAEPVAGGAGTSALADRNGDYAIFNLSPGDYTVRAYARGAVHAPKPATVRADAVTDVDLPISGPATSSVKGSVNVVNPGAGKTTSVVLVVASTYDATLVRGETPPGLRAPEPGTAPNLSGAWEIAAVPPGDYVALAAFENDYLVRDPDVCIAGTLPPEFTLAPGEARTLDSFKVTGSLDVLSPGANGPELLADATPTFSWVDDSSEDAYELTVVDAFGHVVWQTTLPGSSGANPSVTYAGPALDPGYYQFKVKSVSKNLCYLSQTEDLKGVFIVPQQLL